VCLVLVARKAFGEGGGETRVKEHNTRAFSLNERDLQGLTMHRTVHSREVMPTVKALQRGVVDLVKPKGGYARERRSEQ